MVKDWRVEIRSVELDPMDTDHILLGIPDTPENRKLAKEILGETVALSLIRNRK